MHVSANLQAAISHRNVLCVKNQGSQIVMCCINLWFKSLEQYIQKSAICIVLCRINMYEVKVTSKQPFYRAVMVEFLITASSKRSVTDVFITNSLFSSLNYSKSIWPLKFHLCRLNYKRQSGFFFPPNCYLGFSTKWFQVAIFLFQSIFFFCHPCCVLKILAIEPPPSLNSAVTFFLGSWYMSKVHYKPLSDRGTASSSVKHAILI